MAENISAGRIEILQSEIMTPVEVTVANLIQTPIFEWNQKELIKISKHGEPTDTWVEIPQGTLIKVTPPFYIMSRYKCNIPAMEV